MIVLSAGVGLVLSRQLIGQRHKHSQIAAPFSVMVMVMVMVKVDLYSALSQSV